MDNLHMGSRAISLTGVLLLLFLAGAEAFGGTYEVHPSAPGAESEEFETLAKKLQPGDELIVRAGTYSQSGRRAITAKGTQEKPIVIRSAGGESPLFSANPRNNCIEFVDCAHLIIRGLRFQGRNSNDRQPPVF